MKVIEIGNCLPPNNAPGILISAKEDELKNSQLNSTLYRDVRVLEDFSLKLMIRFNEESAIERFLVALYDEKKKSLKMEEISKIYDDQLKVIKNSYRYKIQCFPDDESEVK